MVLKRLDDEEEGDWCAEVFSTIDQVGFRVPTPLRTTSGRWSSCGWYAWGYIEGDHMAGHWEEKIRVSARFHRATVGVPRPDFFSRLDHAWAMADRMVWGEADISVLPELERAIEPLMEVLEPVDATDQVIHGDIGGNILFTRDGDPVVIDFSPYWRPAGFALGVLVADALVYGGADQSILNLVPATAEFYQLLARAEMRRILEIQQLGQDPELVNDHLPTVRLIRRRLEAGFFRGSPLAPEDERQADV